MNNQLMYPIVLLGGFIAGLFFFGGLWFTIKFCLARKLAGIWFLVSFFLRTGIVLTCFYFLSLSDWPKMVLCIIGFILARYLFQKKLSIVSLEKIQGKNEV